MPDESPAGTNSRPLILRASGTRTTSVEPLAAAVQLHPEGRVLEKEIQEYLRARIAGYKVPRTVTFHATLPREDSGKIFKRLLREPYWRNSGRRI